MSGNEQTATRKREKNLDERGRETEERQDTRGFGRLTVTVYAPRLLTLHDARLLHSAPSLRDHPRRQQTRIANTPACLTPTNQSPNRSHAANTKQPTQMMTPEYRSPVWLTPSNQPHNDPFSCCCHQPPSHPRDRDASQPNLLLALTPPSSSILPAPPLS